MAHIVAEQPDGPRGASILTKEQRNSYANLILLCAHHHNQVDKDVSRFPVELLHDIKTSHEQWVTETLGVAQDPADIAYGQIVDDVATGLDLERWDWWTSNAVRNLLPVSIAEAADFVEVRRQVTNWPGKYPRLDDAARAAMDAFSRFVKQYISLAEMRRGGQFLGPDYSFKRIARNTHYSLQASRLEAWSELGFYLLCDLADRTEVFAAAVREEVNPHFFLTYGKFLLRDDMEYRGRGPAVVISRNEIEDGVSKWESELSAILSKCRTILGDDFI